MANLRRRGRAGGSCRLLRSGTRRRSPRAAGARGGGRDAVSYLLGAQHRDGGFGSSPTALRRASCTPGGWRSGSPPPATTRRTSLAGARACSRTCGPGGSRTPARSSGRSSSRGPPGPRPAASVATTSSARWSAASAETARSPSRSTGRRSECSRCAAPASRLRTGCSPGSRRSRAATAGSASPAAAAGSDIDDTGAALEALGHAGSHSSRAIGYLRRHQNLDGGFPSEPGGQSNAQSTAWAAQGLLAAGVDPGSLHRRGAVSPLAFLRSLIAGDGHVRYSRTSDQTPVWVTAQAIMALDRKPLPLAPTPRAKAPPRRRVRRVRRREHRLVLRRRQPALSGLRKAAQCRQDTRRARTAPLDVLAHTRRPHQPSCRTPATPPSSPPLSSRPSAALRNR